jgi:tetratricopeptide (TPR) repeat protein
MAHLASEQSAPAVRRHRYQSAPVLVFLPLVMLVKGGASEAQTVCPTPIARFESVTNSVQIVQASTQAARSAARPVTVCPGDTIRVGDNSRAVVVILSTNTPLAIDQNTEFVVTQPSGDATSVIDLVRGALLYLSRIRQSIVIRTPFVNASIEGTEFVLRVEVDRTVITVFEGSVRAANALGAVVVGPNQQAVAVRNQAPQVQVIVRPRDAVQWALYYEPILPADSFEQLAQVADANRDARFYVRRAALELSAGQLTTARADLQEALRLDPSTSDALALQTIVAVALNDKMAALENGRRAVERASQSASAHIALSYALQANFDLEAARAAAERAVALTPNDATAWSRLAELRLMQEDIAGATHAAERATALAPELSRVHTVEGFTLLARLKLSEAEAAFDRAIARAPDNPVARLGAGLEKIRRGHLAEGRAEIEVAAALDPDDAIIRSYLGKAYFEETREALASAELDAAKTLDPADPTAYYYDAILKQTINRPAEALLDLQKATELNDNRAVYRSRFLLDQDSAARSASLGRVYSDLGFEQLALIEGFKSIETDPTDHPGHRLLADMYSSLPRHEVARVSELLQAQLLQPISLTPVPPRLAETDLFILERAGPDVPGFNEFNSLFNRNRVAVQGSGVIGDNSILGDEVTVAGVWNNVSFSVGQFHYDTDGFRANNGQDRDIFNVFGQVQLSASTSIQAEVRGEDAQTGDLTLLFDPDNYDPTLEDDTTGGVVRFGLRHVFNASSQLIASIYRGHREAARHLSSSFAGVTALVDLESETDGWTFELRHFKRLGRWGFTSGVGYFDASRHNVETLKLVPVGIPESLAETVSSDVFDDDPSQTNAYFYAGLALPRQVNVTLGASADFYSRLRLDRNQFNPKIGATWTPYARTTIRAAAFRTLQRTLVASQTIEPTQVAGFSQLFADEEGESAYRYGLAVDQKIATRMFGGAEYSWRNLVVPIEIDTDVQDFDRSERFGRSYFYWTPLNTVALGADYSYERFDRTPESSLDEQILNLNTHRTSFSARYFSPKGFSATMTATDIHQSGKFANLAFLPEGQDRFWVVDLAAGYRLPRRTGRIAVHVKNLFDRHFNFQDTSPGNPIVKPGRFVVLTVTIGR